jgi:hypothetical protein
VDEHSSWYFVRVSEMEKKVLERCHQDFSEIKKEKSVTFFAQHFVINGCIQENCYDKVTSNFFIKLLQL